MAKKATVNPNPRTGIVRNKGGQAAAIASIDPRTGNRALRALGSGQQK